MTPPLVATAVAAAVLGSGLLAGCGGTGQAGQRPPTTSSALASTPPSSSGSPAGAGGTIPPSSAPRFGTPSPPPAPVAGAGPGGGGFGSVDRSNPTAVAAAAVTTAFTSNARTDTGPFDATRRALIWYTPVAAGKVLAAAPTGPVGAEWLTWTAHQVATTVGVSIDHDAGAPPDTAVAADRQLQVSVTPHGAGGYTTRPDVYQCFVTLTRTGGGPWQVAGLEVTQ